MSMNIANGREVIPQFSMGDRLRKARESAGLSQEELAEEIGSTRRSISRYEQGVPVKKSVLLLYSIRTGVPVAWLESGEYTPRDLNPEPTGYGFRPRIRTLSLVAA